MTQFRGVVHVSIVGPDGRVAEVVKASVTAQDEAEAMAKMSRIADGVAATAPDGHAVYPRLIESV